MRAPHFVLRTHYSMYRRCPQRWRIATVAMDTPPNLLPVQGLRKLAYCASIHLTLYQPYLTIYTCFSKSALKKQKTLYKVLAPSIITSI